MSRPFIEELHRHFRVELEPTIDTLGRKLVVMVASPGWQSTEQNPNIPTTHRAMARAIIDACREGAALVHMHAREEGGRPAERPELTTRILDQVFAECPDVITSTHIGYDQSKHGLEIFTGFFDELTSQGLKYIQTTPLHTRGSMARNMLIWDDALLHGLLRFVEERGVKPEILVYDTFGVERAREAILEAASWKPYWVNLNFGKHHAVPVSHDPWSHLQVITLYRMAREVLPPETVIGAYVGGRNWLPLTVLAIMLGVDVVRVGIEDCLWVYPHRNEIIGSDAEMVRKIVTIARELGREVATPDEARDLLGLATHARVAAGEGGDGKRTAAEEARHRGSR